ncbi:MarR family winged helix-turn-helix transcriptional regulator [Bacillus sp. AFS017336]|uniref:MarR family winged helix-turn-helix transcriptional regulator n=1 Tax=Bacillus sp. AFS017336 TaxID=2033489 RepID=UPI000BEF5740|nr:MarR family transcriptional regulator [Bacillus sp. AFS017336]PEL13484.1 MarR family transcriptional regulator [Bacillus sp. AFS017336]
MEGKNEYIERIQFALQASIQTMQPKLIDTLEHHGVTATQFHLLIYLRKHKRCKMSEIVEFLEVKPSAVSFMIDRLENNNIVYRENDKKDRRVVNILLTEEGIKKIDLVIQDRKEMFENILLNFEEDELLQFVKITEKIATIAAEL